jgi:hypothetical protein
MKLVKIERQIYSVGLDKRFDVNVESTNGIGDLEILQNFRMDNANFSQLLLLVCGSVVEYQAAARSRQEHNIWVNEQDRKESKPSEGKMR